MIGFLGEVLSYLTTSEHWYGSRGLLQRVWEHVTISVIGIAIAALVALPIALYLGHIRRGGFAAISVANIGRAVPSFGFVGVLFPITLAFAITASPLGFWATLFAMVLLAVPPMFVNAYTAVTEIDPAYVEAARGMGMTEWGILRSVEVPLGLPVIMAGVRTAAVAVVATATLGAVVGYGGLGRYIIDGFAQGNDVLIFVGGLLVALLAILTELVFAWVERATDPMRKTRQPGNPATSGDGARVPLSPAPPT